MLATHHLALHEDKVGRQDLSMSSGPEGAEPGATPGNHSTKGFLKGAMCDRGQPSRVGREASSSLSIIHTEVHGYTRAAGGRALTAAWPP